MASRIGILARPNCRCRPGAAPVVHLRGWLELRLVQPNGCHAERLRRRPGLIPIDELPRRDAVPAEPRWRSRHRRVGVRPVSERVVPARLFDVPRGTGVELDRGVAVDPLGRITVAGWTLSPNYPTTAGAFDTSHNGGNDIFISRLDTLLPPASQLVFSTFVGGSLDEGVNDARSIPPAVCAWSVRCNRRTFRRPPAPIRRRSRVAPHSVTAPTTASRSRSTPRGAPALLVLHRRHGIVGLRLRDHARPVRRRVHLGPHALVQLPGDVGVLLGRGRRVPPEDGAAAGGVTRYGFPTPGCAGRPEIGVTSIPQNGNASFAITLGGAPSSSSFGVLGISHLALPSPLFVSALAIFIDPASPAPRLSGVEQRHRLRDRPFRSPQGPASPASRASCSSAGSIRARPEASPGRAECKSPSSRPQVHCDICSSCAISPRSTSAEPGTPMRPASISRWRKRPNRRPAGSAWSVSIGCSAK